jgi:hypothetical protein
MIYEDAADAGGSGYSLPSGGPVVQSGRYLHGISAVPSSSGSPPPQAEIRIKSNRAVARFMSHTVRAAGAVECAA